MASSNVRSKIEKFDIIEADSLIGKGSNQPKTKTKKRPNHEDNKDKKTFKRDIKLRMSAVFLALLYGLYLYYVVTHLILAGDVDVPEKKEAEVLRKGASEAQENLHGGLYDHIKKGQELVDCDGTIISPNSSFIQKGNITAGNINDTYFWNDW